MNSAQESKNELEAAIRYAENAISSAKTTIESMEFRQEMAKKQHSEQTGREQTLQAQVKLLEERIADMQSDMVGDASTIKELRDIIDRMGDDSTGDSVTINQLRRELTVKTSQAEAWRKEYEKVKAEADELRSKVEGQYDDIRQLEYDLATKTDQASAWKKKYYDFKETLVRAGDPRVVEDLSLIHI